MGASLGYKVRPVSNMFNKHESSSNKIRDANTESIKKKMKIQKLNIMPYFSLCFAVVWGLVRLLMKMLIMLVCTC